MGEEKAHKQYRGRLAPTPSGFLHEGHVQTFRTVTDRSRANKGRVIFRMDDLDPNRCTEEYASACLEDIKGMGLEWDEGPDVGGMYGPYEQSKRAHFISKPCRNCTKRDMSIHATNLEKKLWHMVY